MHEPTGIWRAAYLLARTTALFGGLVLIALVVLIGISVLGRGLGSLDPSLGPSGGPWGWLASEGSLLASFLSWLDPGPVTGDFELVEAGMAFCVFAFLPLCQIHRAHASVDVFTRWLPESLDRLLSLVWECLLAAALLLISWRLWAGLEGKLHNGETTFMLQFPLWWSYAASFAASVVAALVSVICAQARLMAWLSGRDPLARHDESAVADARDQGPIT